MAEYLLKAETLSPSPTPGGPEGQVVGGGGLFATIGSVVTLGTGNAWLGIVVIIIVILVAYALIKNEEG